MKKAARILIGFGFIGLAIFLGFQFTNQNSVQVSRVVASDDSLETQVYDEALEPALEKAVGVSINNSVLPWSEEDQEKYLAFMEILRSGKDQDPRLDALLKDLSPALKEKITEEYFKLDRERFAARGLIVFLMGRAMNSIKDFQFVKPVLEEPVVVSDVKRTPLKDHHSATDEITRAYPQHMALAMIEEKLTGGQFQIAAAASELRTLLESLTRSFDVRIAKRAQELLKLLPKE